MDCCCASRKMKKIVLIDKSCQTPRTSIEENIVYEDIKEKMIITPRSNDTDDDLYKTHRRHRIYF